MAAQALAHTRPLPPRRRRPASPVPPHLLALVRERARLEALLDDLLDALNALDGDPDAEPDDDTERDDHAACEAADDDITSHPPRTYGVDHGAGDPEDAEPDGCDEPDADAEPALIPVTWFMEDGSRANIPALRFARGREL